MEIYESVIELRTEFKFPMREAMEKLDLPYDGNTFVTFVVSALDDEIVLHVTTRRLRKHVKE